MSRSLKIIGLILLVLLLDQSLKIWIKTNMEYGEEISLIGNWALLHFVENNGMAFGLSLSGDYGKLALSLFRIVAVIFLIYYIKRLIEENVSMGLLVSFALILAGAIGNILDSAFYGLLFSESPYHGGLATLFPPEGGYSKFLHGKVVDMLYFPIMEGTFPSWMPLWANERFLFFRPVFNLADMSITIGVLSIILFHRDFFSTDLAEQNKEAITSENENAENVLLEETKKEEISQSITNNNQDEENKDTDINV